MPDGRVQHVQYWSDSTGYHASVTYHPLYKKFKQWKQQLWSRFSTRYNFILLYALLSVFIFPRKFFLIIKTLSEVYEIRSELLLAAFYLLAFYLLKELHDWGRKIMKKKKKKKENHSVTRFFAVKKFNKIKNIFNIKIMKIFESPGFSHLLLATRPICSIQLWLCEGIYV